MTMTHKPAPTFPAIRIELRSLDETAAPLPKRRQIPEALPFGAPLPRAGEIVYVSSTSAWRVRLVLHEWLSPSYLRIVVLVDYEGTTHHAPDVPFALTQ